LILSLYSPRLIILYKNNWFRIKRTILASPFGDEKSQGKTDRFWLSAVEKGCRWSPSQITSSYTIVLSIILPTVGLKRSPGLLETVHLGYTGHW